MEITQLNKKFNNSNIFFYQNQNNKLLIRKKEPQYFDLIISNILSTPLIELVSAIRSVSNHGTIIILSGFLDC